MENSKRQKRQDAQKRRMEKEKVMNMERRAS